MVIPQYYFVPNDCKTKNWWKLHIYFLTKVFLCSSGSVISPFWREQLLFSTHLVVKNTTLKMTHRGNTQPNVSAVTSWPLNSAAHTLQSLETPPGPCPASCPGGLPLGSGQALCSCPWRMQGALPCQSPAVGSRRHLAPCSAHHSDQSQGLRRVNGGAGRPGCHGSLWKRTM